MSLACCLISDLKVDTKLFFFVCLHTIFCLGSDWVIILSRRASGSSQLWKATACRFPHPLLFNGVDWPPLKSSTDSCHLVKADTLRAWLLLKSPLRLLSDCIYTGSPVFSWLERTEPAPLKCQILAMRQDTRPQAEQCFLTDFTLEWHMKKLLMSK